MQMSYQKYFKAALFSFGLSCLAFVLVALYQIGAPTESSRWIYEVDTIKREFSDSIKTPKLLISSGSNSLFGISSQLIQQETGVATVNAGLNAALGVDYILHRAKALAKAGDTVILPLEYELYTKSETSDVLVDYAFARDAQYLLSRPWLIALLSFERLKLGLSARFHTPSKITLGYQSKTVNRSGDETNNQESERTREQLKQIDAVQPIAISKPPAPGFQNVRAFANWCNQRKIRLLATWPSTVWFEVYTEPDYQQYFQVFEDFYRELGVTVLGKPDDFMYDKSLFYDSAYHLNDRGMRQRTQQLINLLQPYLSEMPKQTRRIS